MKKFVSLLLVAFSLIMLDFSSENVSSLTFDEAPTLNDYIENRGKDKLEYVIFAIARLNYGANAKNWEELESEGTKLLQNFSPSQIAQIIFVNSFEYKLTKTAYEILMESLKADFAVVDKDYFDPLGNYKPLNGNSIMIRRDIYIDVANLFEATSIMTTTRPLNNGYEYQSNKSLYINALEMSVKTTNVISSSLKFGIVSDPDRDTNRYLPFVGQIGNVYNYSVTAEGASEEYSFFKSKGNYDTSLTELNNLTNLEITLKIGDMEKVLKGSGSISADFELDKVYKIDPSKPVLGDDNGGDGEDGGEGESGNWWDWLTKIWDWITNVLSKFLDSVSSFFDWLKDFFIPDFSNASEKISELVDLFKSKFSSIFDILDMFKNLFVSSKSLHDLRFVINDIDFYPFPKKQTEEPFKILKMILNAAIVLLTFIRCYKRVVGEGDVVE